MKNNFAIFNMDKIRLDLLTILVLIIIFLSIIPINFEKLINPILDIRNISYILIIFTILPFWKHVYNEIHHDTKIILALFLLYFVLEGSLYYYHHGEGKNMYYAVWVFVIMVSIFYVGSSPERLCLLYKMVILSIGLSVSYGVFEIFFGEPFTSIRYYLLGRTPVSQTDVYGMSNEQEIIRMVGLSKKIFSFSYQLAILPIASISMILYSLTRKAKLFWGIIFVISILGILSNAERSAALSSFIGIVFLLSKVLKTKNRKYVFGGALLSILVFSIIIQLLPFEKDKQLEKDKQRFSLQARIEGTDPAEAENKARLLQQIAGAETVLIKPLGVYNYDDYKNIAHKYAAIKEHYGWSITAPHNHFINVGFRAGWCGILLIILIFINIKKCVYIFRQKIRLIEDRFIWIYYGIIISFLANLLNACFHNQGLFFGEQAGILLLALIGAGASMSLK